MNVYEFLLSKANEELDGAGDVASSLINGTHWFEYVISHLTSEVKAADLGEPFTSTASGAIDVLVKNKLSLIGMGQHAFKLFLFQISSGKHKDAIETYIKSLTDPDDLIALMNQGTDGLIQAKRKLDEFHANALKLIGELALMVAKTLLPIILSVI